MKVAVTAAFLALAASVAAQQSALPACAQICFLQAIGKSQCDLSDYYCQCTSGSSIIQKSALSCLCANAGTAAGCSASELLQVQDATNQICSSALAASSETYTATTAGADACKTAAAGGSTGTASSSGAAAGTTTTGASSSSASAAAGASSSSGAAAMPTKMVGLEAALGLAGVVMAAL